MRGPAAGVERREHAVVLGAGVAGLVAARALVDHFSRVTLLERDLLPTEPVPRPGVPQGRHLHGLLPAGLRTLDRLLPGFAAELRSAGAVEYDTGELPYYSLRGWNLPMHLGIRVLSMTRPLLEQRLRDRVASLPQVRLLEGRRAGGLLSDRGRVTGVWHTSTGASAAGGEPLPANLVEDATGRGSRAPRWLAELGYPVPAETVIDPHLGYTSVVLAAPADALGGAAGVMLLPREGGPVHGGVAVRVEGGRWLLTLGGAGPGQQPPRDEAGFAAFAAGLADPAVADLLAVATPLSEVSLHRGTTNRRRHYERLRRHPPGFLAFGDAVCTFNPVYGQGMTVAALCAAELSDALRVGQFDARRLYRRTRAIAQPAWLLAPRPPISPSRPPTDPDGPAPPCCSGTSSPSPAPVGPCRPSADPSLRSSRTTGLPARCSPPASSPPPRSPRPPAGPAGPHHGPPSCPALPRRRAASWLLPRLTNRPTTNPENLAGAPAAPGRGREAVLLSAVIAGWSLFLAWVGDTC